LTLLGGWRLGRIAGIPIQLDLTWFVGLAVFVAVSHTLWSPDATGAGALALSVVFTCVFFCSVLAHELAHALVARALGVPTVEITLFVFGGVARIAEEPPDAGGEALMAMAGPLTSVTLAGLLLLGASLTGRWPSDLLGLLGVSNLVVAGFNLLPGFPLDGGRVARAIIWRLSGSRRLATHLTAWGGRILAAVLVVGGGAAVIWQHSPRYLLHMVLGMFLWRAAGQGERASAAAARTPAPPTEAETEPDADAKARATEAEAP
jgi:Zn-dependent protease